MTIEMLKTQATSSFVGADGSSQKNIDLAWKRQMEKDCFQLEDGRLVTADADASAVTVAADKEASYPTKDTVGLKNNDMGGVQLLQGANAQGYGVANSSRFSASNGEGGVALPLNNLVGLAAGKTKSLQTGFRTGTGVDQVMPPMPNDACKAHSFNPVNVLLTSSGADRCLYVRDFFTSTVALLNWIDTELSRSEFNRAPTRVFVNGKEYFLNQGKLIREENTHGN